MVAKRMITLDDQLELIKLALLSLKAAGPDGFEGVLRLGLTKITGMPFRLAASGLQGGMDGDGALPDDEVCFEAKRYSDSPKRETVLTKIADLARNETAADRLWVLGVTAEVNSQLADAVQQDGDRNAISTLILDWVAEPLPLLAIVVVSAGDAAVNFLIKNFDEKSGKGRVKKDDLVAAFIAVRTDPEFTAILERLKSNLTVSKLAFSRAVEQNANWKAEVFGSTDRSRTHFGQSLAVKKDQNLPELRVELSVEVADQISTGRDVVLSGDEGHGKSWLAAQVCSEAGGMALFVSAERFDGVRLDELEDLLIELLIKQSGEVVRDAIKKRWRHRFLAWRNALPRAKILVVVDGINQRQNIRWSRLLNSLQSLLSEIGGRLVVTVRPQYWKKAIAGGLSFDPKVIEVPEWSLTERDALLGHYGISQDWLDEGTLRTLRNPRLLSNERNQGRCVSTQSPPTNRSRIGRHAEPIHSRRCVV